MTVADGICITQKDIQLIKFQELHMFYPYTRVKHTKQLHYIMNHNQATARMFFTLSIITSRKNLFGQGRIRTFEFWVTITILHWIHALPTGIPSKHGWSVWFFRNTKYLMNIALEPTVCTFVCTIMQLCKSWAAF